MTASALDRHIRVDRWPYAYPPFTVGGSLYAVPRAQRVCGARVLTERQCRIHADLILDQSGRQRGVTLAELLDIWRLVPQAQIDLHLINLYRKKQDPSIDNLVERALQTASTRHATAITLDASQLSRQRRRVDRLRSAGHQIWAEVPPSMPANQVDPDTVDGALVMLIEPGTKDKADLAHLDKVDRLSATLPVGVDGGVTRANAQSCRAAGATYLVSGRDLLSVPEPPLR